jgi:hypothetical protein
MRPSRILNSFSSLLMPALHGYLSSRVPERPLKKLIFRLRAAREPTDAPAKVQAISMAWTACEARLLSCRSAVGIPQPPIPRISSTQRQSFVIRFRRRLLHETRLKHAIDMQWRSCQRDPSSVVFLFAGGSPPACATLAGELSEGFAMTGKRGLRRARWSSCGVR